ncbi:MAG: polysaccharide biosynthesis C-terminal domain-containing protein [Solobacterium sp.]|nr:polysaccharide biosynthesis C-terminal domain-containing protein [Solobacterium sp.]
MSETQQKQVKQSFILGSLTSSAGIFLSKAIGLFYVVPFTAIATENNMVFYTGAYNYYNILLQISSAGLPYAIAALIAKFASRNDYKSVLLVRRLSTLILGASGLVMMLAFIALSGPLSVSLLGEGATPIDLRQMRISFIILSLALFLVPILYSYRSFYQGLKDLKVYANSQVIEQMTRVAALLGLGAFVVYVLHFDRIFAIYMAVLSTSIGAGVAILYYMHYDKPHYSLIRKIARQQEFDSASQSQILKEMFAFGIPYLVVSILGNSQTLINTHFFISLTTSLGMKYETAKLLYGIIQMQCDKLTSIPQVLGIGFSAGIVPYMTIALEKHDMDELQKNVRECLDTVFYIALPICFSMFVLARPVYYLMYGAANLNYGESALRWSSFLALATTITPICSSMMMTLHFRKASIFYLFVGFVVKCVTFYPLIRFTGYSGAITSSVLCSVTIIYLCLAKISNRYDVSYKLTFIRVLKMLLCCLCMNGVFVLLRLVGFNIVENNRLLALLQMAVYGVLGAGVYFYVSILMKLPQAIFHIGSMREFLRRLVKGQLHRRRRDS